MSGAISSVVVILAAKAVVAGVGLTAAALADSLKRPKVTGNDQLSRTVQHNRNSIDAGMLVSEGAAAVRLIFPVSVTA